MPVDTATFSFATGTLTGRLAGTSSPTFASIAPSGTITGRIPAARGLSVASSAQGTSSRLQPSRGTDAGNLAPTGPINNRSGIQRPLTSIGVSSGSGAAITTYFKKRSRDSGSPTPAYVTWVTTIAAQPYPFSPPFGGPLVDEVIADTWQV